MTTINDSYHTPTNGYRARIGTLPAIFTEVTLNLEQSIPRIFHRKYGLGDGLNCLVIGDDLKLVADTVCTSLYNTIFGLRLPLLFLGFGILFAMCCTTCSGVRAYKQ